MANRIIDLSTRGSLETDPDSIKSKISHRVRNGLIDLVQREVVPQCPNPEDIEARALAIAHRESKEVFQKSVYPDLEQLCRNMDRGTLPPERFTTVVEKAFQHINTAGSNFPQNSMQKFMEEAACQAYLGVAFEHFYIREQLRKKCRPLLHQFAPYRIDEAVQEIITRTLEMSPERIIEIENLPAYMKTGVYNLAQDYVSELNRHSKLLEKFPYHTNGNAHSRPDHLSSPDSLDVKRYCWSFMALLPNDEGGKKQKKLFQYVVEERTLEEIVSLTGYEREQLKRELGHLKGGMAAFPSFFHHLWDSLDERQQQVVGLSSRGYLGNQIAKRLGISKSEVSKTLKEPRQINKGFYTVHKEFRSGLFSLERKALDRKLWGKTTRQIASELALPRSAVLHLLQGIVKSLFDFLEKKKFFLSKEPSITTSKLLSLESLFTRISKALIDEPGPEDDGNGVRKFGSEQISEEAHSDRARDSGKAGKSEISSLLELPAFRDLDERKIIFSFCAPPCPPDPPSEVLTVGGSTNGLIPPCPSVRSLLLGLGLTATLRVAAKSVFAITTSGIDDETTNPENTRVIFVASFRRKLDKVKEMRRNDMASSDHGELSSLAEPRPDMMNLIHNNLEQIWQEIQPVLSQVALKFFRDPEKAQEAFLEAEAFPVLFDHWKDGRCELTSKENARRFFISALRHQLVDTFQKREKFLKSLRDIYQGGGITACVNQHQSGSSLPSARKEGRLKLKRLLLPRRSRVWRKYGCRSFIATQQERSAERPRRSTKIKRREEGGKPFTQKTLSSCCSHLSHLTVSNPAAGFRGHGICRSEEIRGL